MAQNDTIDRREGEKTARFKPFPLPLTRTSIAGFVALTNEVLNIKDVYELDGSVEYSFNRDFDRRNDYRSQSMLVVPMLDHRGENIGVLQLINAVDPGGRVTAFPQNLQDLVLSLASQAAVAVRNAKLIASIKDIFSALVQYSASAIDARSPHTAGHSRRVAALSLHMAQAINEETNGRFRDIKFSEEELEELSYAAWLHDIGKIGVPEHLLEKTPQGGRQPPGPDQVQIRKNRPGLSPRLPEKSHRTVPERPPDPDQEAGLKEELDHRLAELDAELALIVKLNVPGWVTDEEITALDRIASKKFCEPDGTVCPYIDDFEYENLGVRKGNLTQAEYQEIQAHVRHTQNIVAKIPFTPELARIPFFAAAHHEMLNGTGYPHGLKDDEIPLQARIMGVADIYDALVALDRPYKKALPRERALDILREEAGNGRLDADLVDLFIRREIGLIEGPGLLASGHQEGDCS